MEKDNDASTLTEKEQHLMKHALGLNSWQDPKHKDGKLIAYRNRYCAANPSEENTIWNRLTERGFAETVSHSDARMRFFKVTNAGKELLGQIMGETIKETD